jgi:hypothetical protein
LPFGVGGSTRQVRGQSPVSGCSLEEQTEQEPATPLFPAIFRSESKKGRTLLDLASSSSPSPESAQDAVSQARDYDWLPVGFRVIPDWPYVMNFGMDVWSLPREVPCKGGKTRQTSARKLKPDNSGRVTFSFLGRMRRYHVENELFPLVFPDRVLPKWMRHQLTCRNNHPLVEFEHEILKRWMTPKPAVAYWGTGNRVCLHCCTPPATYPHDKTYSQEYGVLRAYKTAG